MSREEKTNAVLRDVLLKWDMANAYQRESLLTDNRLYLFLLITQESVGQKPDDYTIGCASALDRMIRAYLPEGVAKIIYLPGDAPRDSLPELFDQCVEEANREQAVRQLLTVSVCPVILGGTFFDNTTENLIAEAWLGLQETVRLQGKQLQWHPFLLLERGDQWHLDRGECIALARNCVQILRQEGEKDSMEPSKRLCVIMESDQLGMGVSLENRMKTVLLTAVLPGLVPHIQPMDYQGAGDNDVFTARSVAVTTPVYSLLLEKLGSTLRAFFTEKSDTPQNIAGNFSAALQDFPETVFWRAAMDKLPRKNGSIVTEPLWSVPLDGQNEREDRNRLNRFMERYYLSYLPVDQEITHVPNLVRRFLECYFRAGGSVLSMGEILNGSTLQSIRQRAANYQLNVTVSSHTESDNGLVSRAEQFLAGELRNRSGKMMEVCLAENGDFLPAILRKAADTRAAVDEICDSIHRFRRQWVHDEVTMQEDQEVFINQRLREEIQKTFIETIQMDGDDRFEAILPYVESIAKGLQNTIPGRQDYMQSQDRWADRAITSDWERIREILDRKLQLPIRLAIAPGLQYFLIGNEQSALADGLKNSYGAAMIPSAGRERLELYCVSGPFPVEHMVGVKR